MKFSSRIEACELSPIRKFHPYVVAAEAQGRKVLHLNIGQPDIETPKAFFDAVKQFADPVLEYAPSTGVEAYLEAVRDYYAQAVNVHPGGRRRDPGSRALLSQLHHLHRRHRRRGAPHSHGAGKRLPLRPAGAHRAPD